MTERKLTNFDVDASVWRRVKAQAALQGRLLRGCVEEALSEWLERQEQAEADR